MIPHLLVIGIDGAIQVVGREERGLGQQVRHVAATAAGAHAPGARNGNGHVLAELDDIAVVLLQDGEIRVRAYGRSIIIGHLRHAQGTFLIGLGEAEGVTDGVAAAGHAHNHIVVGSILVDGLGEPVRTVPLSFPDPLHLDRHGRFDIVEFMQARLADQIQVLRGGNPVDAIGVRLLDTRVRIESNGRFLLTDLALARGHEDDTVRRAGTVDGRRRRILQDVDGFDVGRVQVLEVTAGHTVDDDEGARGAGGADTTDRDVVTGARTTTGLDDVHTRNGAVQGAQRIRRALLLDILTRDVDRGTRKQALLLGTITDDDRFIQELGVFLEHDIDDRASIQLLFLGSETDAGEREGGVRRNGNRVVTIPVREGAHSVVTAEHDSDTDDRFATRV